jgi:hypothetical protein
MHIMHMLCIRKEEDMHPSFVLSVAFFSVERHIGHVLPGEGVHPH